MTKSKSWFAVRVLLESQHPEEPDVESLFEDRIVLVRADDEDEARRRGEDYGKGEECEYKNTYDKIVRELFREVLDVVDVMADQIGDLTEVYHHYLTPKELKHVRRALEPLPDGVEAAPL